jgi:Zinc finger, C2H2 type
MPGGSSAAANADWTSDRVYVLEQSNLQGSQADSGKASSAASSRLHSQPGSNRALRKMIQRASPGLEPFPEDDPDLLSTPHYTMLPLQSAHYCAQCNRSFDRAYILRGHKNAVSGVKPYSCERCSTKFTRKHDLEMHQAEQHSGAPPKTTCRVVNVTGATQGCDKVFKRQSDLARHLSALDGRFCRLPELGNMTSDAVSPAAAKQQPRALSLSRAQLRHRAWRADPVRENLLDQNLIISWRRCVLNAAVALKICCIKLHMNLDQSQRTFWIHCGNTIRIAQYCLNKGDRGPATECALALYFAVKTSKPSDADFEDYSEHVKAHEAFLDEQVEYSSLALDVDVHESLDSLIDYEALADSAVGGFGSNALNNSNRSLGHSPAKDRVLDLEHRWGLYVWLQNIQADIEAFLVP